MVRFRAGSGAEFKVDFLTFLELLCLGVFVVLLEEYSYEDFCSVALAFE
ncbi:MAG: hypothetical protein ACI9E1_002225 [Cryomorphaceae bacterium]|jgi:hypothetical protein